MQVEQLKNYKSDSPDVRSRLNPQKSAFLAFNSLEFISKYSNEVLIIDRRYRVTKYSLQVRLNLNIWISILYDSNCF